MSVIYVCFLPYNSCYIQFAKIILAPEDKNLILKHISDTHGHVLKYTVCL